MSAAGIVISENEIHLLSDGILSYKDDNGEWKVEKRNVNKIKMIHETTGLLWLGAGLIKIWQEAKEQIQQRQLTKPWEIAHVVSNTLKKYYDDNEIDLSARVLIAGFDDRKPVLYEITSTNEFTIEPVEIPAGSVYAWNMIHGSEGKSPFVDLVGKYLQQSNNLSKIANRAFTETLRQYKDVTVGGSTHWRGFSADGLIGGSDSAETGIPNSGLDDERIYYHGADDASGTNAKFFTQADGNIFHPLIGRTFFHKFSIADVGINTTQSVNPDQDILGVETSINGLGSVSEDRRKIEGRNLTKQFSENTLRVEGSARKVNQATEVVSGSYTFTNEIRANVIDGDNLVTILATNALTPPNSALTTFTLDVDISGIQDGKKIIVRVRTIAEIESGGQTDSSDTATAETAMGAGLRIQTKT